MTASDPLFTRAGRVMPGGVNSPVRAFGAVGGTPVFMTRGEGARVTAADGRVLLDFCGSWGPLILGHAHPEVVAATQKAVADGLTFGACTAAEVEFAERLCSLVPGMDRVRLVCSGTEAVMTAVRLARGSTGRSLILKFDGGYHGHSDSLLAAAGSGVMTHGIAGSAGVTPGTVADTMVLPYNDVDRVEQLVAARGHDLAAILVEPVAGNMGLVLPAPGFLPGLRRLADACGAILIADEVITGFRFGPTTCCELIGMRPDLVTLGKIIGGGLPLAAVGGRADLMRGLAPLGPVYQAGTLSGNPVAIAAGHATLDILLRDRPYAALAARTARLAESLNRTFADSATPAICVTAASLFTPFFRPPPAPANRAEVQACDTRAYARFFHGMLDRGIYLPPSQFEVAFLSTAHADADVEAFAEAAVAAIARAG